MKKDALLVTILIVLLASLLAINTVSSPPSTVIGTQPRWKTAPVGSTFNIKINVTDVLDLYGWEINMTFAKTVLNVVTVVEGPFLSDFASLVGVNTFFLGPTINNASGWVDVGCSLFPNPDPPDGADGSGVLATVTFKVMKYGRSDLHFTLSKLNSFDPGTGLPVPISHTATDGIFDNRISGDANTDKTVNVFDILAVKSRWATTPASPDWIPDYDVNYDSTINVFDILTVKAHWGQTTP